MNGQDFIFRIYKFGTLVPFPEYSVLSASILLCSLFSRPHSCFSKIIVFLTLSHLTSVSRFLVRQNALISRSLHLASVCRILLQQDLLFLALTSHLTLFSFLSSSQIGRCSFRSAGIRVFLDLHASYIAYYAYLVVLWGFIRPRNEEMV
jgi:hypothetical protein